MPLPLGELRTDPPPADWVPADSCTLPTGEQPLRVAEFDAVFAASLRAVEHLPTPPTRARLLLAGDETLVARVQQLADAEKSCCSFFAFTVTPLGPVEAGVPGPTLVALDIEVPAGRSDALTALVQRARRTRPAAA